MGTRDMETSTLDMSSNKRTDRVDSGKFILRYHDESYRLLNFSTTA